MFKINDDLSIFVTRGDALVFNLSATTDNGETYIFKPEDMVRIKIMEKKGCDEVVFQKGFTITEETDTVEIALTGEETTIGDVISKPTDYWYEIELNPFTHPQTIIGYDDETGAKIFKLFPEGNSDLKAKDIPIVDSELDLYSDRPVQNQAIAWAVTNAINEMHITTEKAVEDTVTITNDAIAEVNTITENAVNEVHTSNENTLAEVNTLVGEVREELQNVPNADNMSNLQTQITENKNSLQEHLQATDPHNIENGLVNKGIADEVSEDDKVLVVVDGEIKKTNVDNIGVRELESSVTVSLTTVLKDGWEVMNEGDLTISNCNAVTYGNGIYVCVGMGGYSYYSTDGLVWQVMGRTGDALYGVTYGDGRFVCVGVYSKSYYSTDGLTWTAMTGLLGTSSNCRAVTYGDGRFVCVGDSGLSYYSTDGQTWQAMSGLDTSVTYYGVTYGDGKFVSVGTTGSSYYSTDGVTWQVMSGLDTSDNYNGVTYGNDRFVCVGQYGSAYYSKDGLAWIAMTKLDTAHKSVAYGNNRFVCVGGNGSSHYSIDGETWTAMTGLESATYNGVTYGTEFVCVGNTDSYHYVYEAETKTDHLQGTLQVAGTLLLTKLYASQTTVTIEDASITQDSTFDIYTDKYGVNPKNVTVNTGSITLEFKAQETDVNIKVVVK